MKPFRHALAGLFLLSLAPACTDVSFEALPNPTCVQYAREFGPEGGILNPNGYYEFKYSVTTGEVDILLVNDNSGSMYPEQVEMAQRFPGFLDSIYRLDYHLAMVTTDTASNGGVFLKFPNGASFLANSSRTMDAVHATNISFFQQTVKRPETLTCDSSGYTSCPSGDERGIYALNLAMDRADQKSFFRPGGHLAVIILSDEDERSNGGLIPGYPLENYDLPQSFVSRAGQALGASKSVSVHSIIIRPGDASCFSAQNSQSGVKGYYGTQYAALSSPGADLLAAGPIKQGTLGSICSSNYTAELGQISNYVNQATNHIQLPCKPMDGVVQVAFDPAPSGGVSYSVDQSNLLTLSPSAPAGTKVSLEYRCQR